MKKIYLLLSLLFLLNLVYSQVVFTDNFNTSTGTAYTTAVGAIGSSAVWNMNRSGDDWGARIDGGILDLTNDGSGALGANGWIFANTATAAFLSPYNPQLNLNTATLTWTFNMRQSRPDPSGFGGTNTYGVAFVLASSTNNTNTASDGYAVVLGQSGDVDPVRLIRFTNGLRGTITNIITSNTSGLSDFGTEYLSIKVTYIPTTDTWELFVRNDGTSGFADPSTGVLTSQGTSVDNTFTGQVLGFLGGYWQGGTSAGEKAFFDNISVSLASTNSANSDIIPDASFTTPSNINYSLHQGITLTLANSIEVAKFTIRDGGGAADADAVGTILNSISFSLSNSANIRRVAIMDGSTQLQEVAGAATITFTHPDLATYLVAPDDGTKEFSLRVVFANNVTDNQQFQFAITATSTAITGSQFTTSNAGGATSSTASDNNKIEVIADGLSYLINTYSPTGNGVAMAPAVQVAGTDTLNFNGNLYTNLDLDFAEQINITSTGTLTGGTVTLPAVAGVANFAGLIHTLNGTGFTLNAERTTTLDWDVISNPFDIINASNATDYFRSVQDGTWDNPSTWESSPDNATWQASTLVPTSTANNIYVRAGDTVTITSNASADELVIENGGTLIQNNTPVFTIDDGADTYDMLVGIGGTFILNGRQPIGLGSIGISGGGTVKIASNNSPAEGDDFAYSAAAVASVTFFDNSYYDWAIASPTPSWSGRTYFTSGNNTFFRFLLTPSFNLGGNSPTIINGTLVALANITIQGTGSKTFVNGIINDALIDTSHNLGTPGIYNINGNFAYLGGTGTINLPPLGVSLGATTVLSCIPGTTPTKTLNGDVSFGTNTKVFLTDTDLTITENILGTSSTAFFVTNGLSNPGKLVRPNVGITPIEYAIGHSSTTYNPVFISNGDNLTYGVKVFNSIQPTSVFNDNNLVNRTWFIQPNGTPSAPVNVSFNYGATDGNPGFNYTSNVEVGLYTSVWNVIQSNITPAGTYSVTANVSAFGANIDAPMVIGNLGSILSVSKKLLLEVKKQNGVSQLIWHTSNLGSVKSYNIERSNNGISFTTISAANGATNNYRDASPFSGNNYYRIKSIEQNGSITYSNVIVIRHNSDFVFISPSVATSRVLLTINSLTNQKINIVITDALGKQITNTSNNIKVGDNKLPMQVDNFSSGLYFVTIYFNNGFKTTTKFLKQ